MKDHKGMRPHDIVVLLKIASMPTGKDWKMKDLAEQLYISASEISESLHRSAIAQLISEDKRTVMRRALYEFLIYGLRYVFPAQIGSPVRGLPTAHSAPPVQDHIQFQEILVWPWASGETRGLGLTPLYTKAPMVCTQDKPLYALLSLVDSIRIGRAREYALATELLEEKLLNDGLVT